jgi:photosystem II stability/assembly factor-like uncharacterized protein
MNDAFHNLVSLDKPRGQLTKKKCISLLILMTITALFATPTVAFARGNVRDDSQLHTASPTRPPHPNSSSNPTTSTAIPLLISLHMLDKIHGWALTQNSILHTVDGGLHWQNVTPANAFSNTTTPMPTPQSAFLNDQDAWVVTPVATPPSRALNGIRVLRTTDSGKSWQSTNILTPAGARTDAPHFLNPSNGWLQTFGQAGDSVSAIFHTTDGGKSWNEPGKLNQSYIPDPSGSSFSDDQTGWEAGDNPTASMNNATNNAQPLLDVTHNGGKTWQNQSLPVLPGGGKSDMLSTRPPVFFGNTGLLPVEDQIVPPRGSKSSPNIGLNLYVTHNGGQTWTPTKLVTSNGPYTFTIDVVDSQHAWATLGTILYATSDSGQSWPKLPPTPQPLGTLDFIDANNGWAISSGGVIPGSTKNQLPSMLHTIDGGHTWQQINYSIVGKA